MGPKGQINAIRMTAPGDGYPRISSIKVNTEKGRGAVLQAMTDKMYLSRPYTSKWTAKFARDSLLYWKCVGSRQDGRSDGQYPDDIDFGPAHEAHASPQECQVIGRWIDNGVQN